MPRFFATILLSIAIAAPAAAQDAGNRSGPDGGAPAPDAGPDSGVDGGSTDAGVPEPLPNDAFGGLGMVVTLRQNWVTVVRVVPGTPAQRAGLREGDRIVRVDRQSTRLRGLREVVTWMRGRPGTAVDIYVQRQKRDGGYSRRTRRFRMRREIIRVGPQLRFGF